MERTEEQGTIRINDQIFGGLVGDAIELTKGKAVLSTEKRKILQSRNGGLPGPGDILDNIVFREDADEIYLEYCIIMTFGASIFLVTNRMLDYLQRELSSLFPGTAFHIKIRIVGVRSRQIAERDLEVERQWS